MKTKLISLLCVTLSLLCALTLPGYADDGAEVSDAISVDGAETSDAVSVDSAETPDAISVDGAEMPDAVSVDGAETSDDAELLSETLASGDCGYGMTWRLDVDGVFTVSGKGIMTDYASANTAPWRNKYGYDIEKVNIEYGVTRIGNYAFNGLPNLIALTIPETVKTIGDSAFADCQSLSDIHFTDDGLQEIERRAFTGCSKLKTFPLPATVTDIGQSAFSYCTALTDFQISGTLTETQPYLFSGCTALSNVTLPATLHKIGQRTFSGCTALTEIAIPGRVSVIGPYAFEKCASLQSVTIPGGVEEIDNGTFSGCVALASVGIPQSVRNIKGAAFQSCNALRDVYYSGTATQWTNVSMVDFREHMDKYFTKVHYGTAEAVSDVAIETISVSNGRVTVEISGNPSEGSSLLIASYDADGCFLGVDSYSINDPNAYTVFARDAHTLTAILLDSYRRPAAKALSKKVT